MQSGNDAAPIGSFHERRRAVMATSTVRDDVFVWSNLLTASPVFHALTWLFQIMPLFFFAGVAASVKSWSTSLAVGVPRWGSCCARRVRPRCRQSDGD